jgi:hypothetical protein
MGNLILAEKVVIKKMPVRAMSHIMQQSRNPEEFLNIV